jgi:hypothetical protein
MPKKSAAVADVPAAMINGTGTKGQPAPGLDPKAAHVAPSPADPPEIAVETLSPRARKVKADAKKAAAKGKKDPKAKKPGNLGAAGFERRKKGPDLREDLRAFVQARPGGWGHEDWLAFLDHLTERGHDTSDPDGIGLLLESERLTAMLERVAGMGPRRISAVVDRYHTAWSTRHADLDEVAALPNMNLALAEKVRQALAE